jgi:Protein of unknown function (DUF1566)
MVLWAGTAAAVSDADKCEAAKLKVAGKYDFCRLKAEAKAVKTGNPVDYSKCDAKFTDKWATAEAKGGGMCPTNGDAANVQGQVTVDANFIAVKLAGVRFVDNGDGTVTDAQTGLMWEKKDDGGLLHDKDNTYTWADAMGEFVSEVNGYSADGTAQAGLGGHSDWRMPTSAELQTILLAPFPCGTSPCIDSTFGPTVASFYWSSTTDSGNPTSAWDVTFDNGTVLIVNKANAFYVRAVRGGS